MDLSGLVLQSTVPEKDPWYTAVPTPIRGRCWEHRRHERSSHRRTVGLPRSGCPRRPELPKILQGFGFAMLRRRMIRRLSRRYGSVFGLKLPMFGSVVVVSDPQLAKQIFTTSPDELGNIQPNLSRLFGSGSVFALEGDDHRRRRRLLAPPFHGKSIKNYESHHRRRDAARDRRLAAGNLVRHAAADDADHAERDPARGVRRRRRRTRRVAPADPAVGHPGLASGGAAETQTRPTVDSARGAGWPSGATSTTTSSRS